MDDLVRRLLMANSRTDAWEFLGLCGEAKDRIEALERVCRGVAQALHMDSPTAPADFSHLPDAASDAYGDYLRAHREKVALQSRLDAIEGRMAEGRGILADAGAALPLRMSKVGFRDNIVDADGYVFASIGARDTTRNAIIAALNLLHEEKTDG